MRCDGSRQWPCFACLNVEKLLSVVAAQQSSHQGHVSELQPQIVAEMVRVDHHQWVLFGCLLKHIKGVGDVSDSHRQGKCQHHTPSHLT